MIVHLVDGTYELYRQHYGQAVRSSEPSPHAATIGVLNSTFQLLADGASFSACDANTAITIGKTGSSGTTATGIDVLLSYVIEAA